jgi:hypothetical protein
MFLSFDMSTFNCVTDERIVYFQQYISTYLTHPAAGKYNGKSILSTFGKQLISVSVRNVEFRLIYLCGNALDRWRMVYLESG